MNSKEIRVPYRHLEQEVQIELSSISVSPESNSRPENGQATGSESNVKNTYGLRILVLGSIIAAGVQFGWALQLSLLTPYIQYGLTFVSKDCFMLDGKWLYNQVHPL